MPGEQLKSNNNSPDKNPNQAPTLSKEVKKELSFGARALSKVRYQNKEIVASSYNKAKKLNQKLADNPFHYNHAYLARLENLVDEHGNNFEKKLWRLATDKLIIKPENIKDNYWKTQEQILRDDGHARELNDADKEHLTKEIQKVQRESLESWANYLGDEKSPFPIWFKVYAWDGISKMGTFNQEKQRYNKRYEHTVAPFPKLNPAVLAKVHTTIEDFYGHADNERYQENEERDHELEALVKSGNFNHLYSKILLSEKTILKTPERTEDIKGEWLEYLPGQEELLADAAEGTPWCIVDPGIAKNYLEYGNYSGDPTNYNLYDDYKDDRRDTQNNAKFLLFHLYDPETKQLADSACASIRFDMEGKVVEISGLQDSQALEDSLVPIVEEKVRTLPGGEDFLEAFEDKRTLIALDHKMQNDEDLTKEELEFVYEINHEIKSIDTYATQDTRVGELRERYDIKYALEKGVDADSLASKINPLEVATEDIDALLDYGANADNVVAKLDSEGIAQNLDSLLAHDANINLDNLVPEFFPDEIITNFNTLLTHGADVNVMASGLHPYQIVQNLDAFIQHKADINNIASLLGPEETVSRLDTLLEHGANANNLASRLYPDDVGRNLNALLSHGADANNLVSILYPIYTEEIAKNLGTLLSHGADAEELVSMLSPHFPEAIAQNLEALSKRGVDIDANNLP